jgi:hypothetical protein
VQYLEYSRILIDNKVKRGITYASFVVISVVYCLVVVHTPIALLPESNHDDGLYMSLGQSIAEGEWLGKFSNFTLMKGPGYPIFLAVSNWLGLSVSLAHALFRCVAVGCFVAVCHRFIKVSALSALLFVLLLWHPIFLSSYLLRVLRDQIYGPQFLAFLAAFIPILFLDLDRNRRLLLAALSGIILGWFWLTPKLHFVWPTTSPMANSLALISRKGTSRELLPQSRACVREVWCSKYP